MAAAAGVTPLVQDVDTATFPVVTFKLILPPSAVPVAGEIPEVAVTENGHDIPNVTVSSLAKERTAIDAVLLLDTSGSMDGAPLANAKLAARRFIDGMGAQDRIAVVAFASEPRLVSDFTADRTALYAAVDGLGASGETSLYDGIVEAARVAGLSSATERYIIALSDGGDTMSLNSAESASGAVAKAGAPVYAVALKSPEYNPATLGTIARQSSGRLMTASTSGALGTIYESIAQELQLRYRVSFRSSRPNTVDIELAVTVGGGAGAGRTTFTVANPLYSAPVTDNRSPFEPLTEDRASLILAVSLGALAVVVFAVGGWMLLRRERAALSQLEYYDLASGRPDVPEHLQDQSIRGRLIQALSAVVERQGLLGKVQRLLEAGGIALRANEFIYLVVLADAVLVLGAWVLARNAFAVLLAAVLAAVLPVAFLRVAGARRLKKFEQQLPDILDLIAGSLRSGWGVQQALDLVVDEVSEPSRSEFRRTQAEARLGMPFDEALQRMAQRVESADLRWAVNAISIQREVGGNLAEVLGVVSATIRERGELGRLVSALTAEGRVSLVVLTVLPFAVFGFLFMMNREYVMVALTNPLGIGAFIFGAILLIAGISWLNKIIKIEV